MKTISVILGSILIAMMLIPNISAQDDKAAATTAKDGKTIFTESKCMSCHSISALGIESTNKKTKAPDLSDVGTRLKADFISLYLTKKETLNDKKHLIPFKGEAADLDILAKWLESQKTAPKAE